MSQPTRPSYPPRLLTAAVVCFMVWVAWSWHRTEPLREPYQLIPVTVVFGTPVVGELPTANAFEATITAWIQGTVTAVPSATRPPNPTATARVSCTSDLPAGTACSPATAAPTPMPTYPTAEVQTPLPTWPGADLATPGVHYQMGKSDE